MKNRKENLFYYIKNTIGEIYHVKPRQFVLLYVFFLLNGILSGFILPCTELLFSQIEEVANGTKEFMHVFVAAIVLMGIRIAEQTFSFLAGFLGESYDMHSYRVLKEKLNQKASKLSAQDYENAEIISVLSRAKNGIRGFVQFVNVLMDIGVNYFPYFVITAVYLWKVNPVLLLILLIVFLSIIGEQIVSVKIYSKMENNSSQIQLQNDYFEECIRNRNIARETRTLFAQPFFLGKLQTGLERYREIIRSGNKSLAKMGLITSGIVLAEYTSILLLMIYILLKGEMTVAAFAAIFTSIDTLFTTMQVLIQGRISVCVKFYASMKNYIYFINKIVPNNHMFLQTDEGRIQIKHVSFQYPNTKKKALDDISFCIEKGEIIALVGENGCGKSTLAKLLTGLYQPTEGKIYFSDKIGIPTKRVSALFQSFSKYPFSFKDNIRLGDTEKLFDEMRYEMLLEEANLKEVRSILSENEETLLSVEFGGTDLSGGQWQRVALARALYRDSGFFIMDEPTSALDPISEIEFYKQMEKIMGNKTVLIITHRMGAVKFADRVLVMKEGKIIDFDKHERLLKSCQYYKEFWEKGIDLGK